MITLANLSDRDLAEQIGDYFTGFTHYAKAEQGSVGGIFEVSYKNTGNFFFTNNAIQVAISHLRKTHAGAMQHLQNIDIKTNLGICYFTSLLECSILATQPIVCVSGGATMTCKYNYYLAQYVASAALCRQISARQDEFQRFVMQAVIGRSTLMGEFRFAGTQESVLINTSYWISIMTFWRYFASLKNMTRSNDDAEIAVINAEKKLVENANTTLSQSSNRIGVSDDEDLKTAMEGFFQAAFDSDEPEPPARRLQRIAEDFVAKKDLRASLLAHTTINTSDATSSYTATVTPPAVQLHRRTRRNNSGSDEHGLINQAVCNE